MLCIAASQVRFSMATGAVECVDSTAGLEGGLCEPEILEPRNMEWWDFVADFWCKWSQNLKSQLSDYDLWNITKGCVSSFPSQIHCCSWTLPMHSICSSGSASRLLRSLNNVCRNFNWAASCTGVREIQTRICLSWHKAVVPKSTNKANKKLVILQYLIRYKIPHYVRLPNIQSPDIDIGTHFRVMTHQHSQFIKGPHRSPC